MFLSKLNACHKYDRMPTSNRYFTQHLSVRWKGERPHFSKTRRLAFLPPCPQAYIADLDTCILASKTPAGPLHSGPLHTTRAYAAPMSPLSPDLEKHACLLGRRTVIEVHRGKECGYLLEIAKMIGQAQTVRVQAFLADPEEVENESVQKT